MPYEVPIDERSRGAIEEVVLYLAWGDLEGLVEAGQLAPHAVDHVATVLGQAGTVVIALPDGWWRDSEAVMFPVREPEEWCALLPLWTQEVGRGPLWLEVDLYVGVGGTLAVIERVFVRSAKT